MYIRANTICMFLARCKGNQVAWEWQKQYVLCLLGRDATESANCCAARLGIVIARFQEALARSIAIIRQVAACRVIYRCNLLQISPYLFSEAGRDSMSDLLGAAHHISSHAVRNSFVLISRRQKEKRKEKALGRAPYKCT